MTCGCCGTATMSRSVRPPAYTPPISLLGGPASGNPVGSRIEDEPMRSSPYGVFAGQMRPKALLLDRPRGLLTPLYWAVLAPGLLTPLNQWGLLALNICTAPPRAEAWSPLAAKSGGTFRTCGPLGSIDRNEPGRPTPGGAPKFDRLPTRIRFGSSIAPGWM